jgi:hypothetical protein
VIALNVVGDDCQVDRGERRDGDAKLVASGLDGCRSCFADGHGGLLNG